MALLEIDLRVIHMRELTRQGSGDTEAWPYGITKLTLTLLSILFSLPALAQEAPPPEHLAPRQTKQLAMTREIIQKALSIVESSNEPWTAALWADIAEARARAGDIQGAVDVFRRFCNDNQSLKGIAKAAAPYLLRRGATPQAFQALASSTNGDARFIVFRATIFAQVHTGEVAGAFDSLGQMSRAVARGQTEQSGKRVEISAEAQRETALAMRTVAVALAQSGSLARATDVALEIKDNALRVGALLPIGAAQLRAGDRRSAENTFKQAEEAIQGIADKATQANVMVQLAKAQAQGKDTEAAFGTAEILHKRDTPFGSFYENALSEIAFEQAQLGDTTGASKTAQRIETTHGRLAALERIASLQLKNGNREGALFTCQEGLQALSVAKSESREIVSQIARIAVIQSDAGDSEAASKSLERAAAMAASLKSAEAQFSALADVAVVLAQMGNIEPAERLDGRIPVDYWEEKGRISSSIAQSEAQSNHPFEALGRMLSAECPQGNQRRPCLEKYDIGMAEVARALTRSGNEKLALSWAEGSSFSTAKAMGFLEIAKGLLDQISPPLAIWEEDKMSWDSY